jgi:hypothetical protein
VFLVMLLNCRLISAGMAVAGIMGDSATDPMERAAEDPVDQTSNLPSIGQVQKSVRQAQAISNTTDDPKLQVRPCIGF